MNALPANVSGAFQASVPAPPLAAAPAPAAEARVANVSIISAIPKSATCKRTSKQQREMDENAGRSLLGLL